MAKMTIEEMESYKGVYVFAQQVDNKVSSIAFELIGKGKDLAADLGTDVTAVLIGSDVKGLADELAEYGADRVIVVDDPELKEYRTEPYTHALASVINEFKPEIMLIGATAIGRDLGPRVSARVKTGLTADCTSLDIGDFPIAPETTFEELEKIYGIKVNKGIRSFTIADLFMQEFSDIEIGDRLILNSIELVVHAIEEGRVTEVGIDIDPSRHRRPKIKKILFFHKKKS